MLVLNDFLNSLYDFLLFDREVMDNLISTIIYVIYLYICVKNGANWITMLIGYLVISTVLEFLSISSYLNILSLLDSFVKSIMGTVEPYFKEILDAIGGIFRNIFPWW